MLWKFSYNNNSVEIGFAKAKREKYRLKKGLFDSLKNQLFILSPDTGCIVLGNMFVCLILLIVLPNVKKR